MNNNGKFFDHMALTWDQEVTVDQQKISHILDVTDIAPGESVLDVGTGTGVLIPYLLERVGTDGRVEGIDVSQGMLDRARTKFGNLPNVHFRLADVEADTIEGRYDHITMYCMYPHLQQQYDTLEWLVKLNLRPGGTLVIAHPESKEAINAIPHHNAGPIHTNHLVEASLVREVMADRGITADYIEDNEEFYIVRLRRT